MSDVDISIQGGIATVVMSRGKVNALNESQVDLLTKAFADLERKPDIRAVILTGAGNFFSFGFDVPELYDYSPEDFATFLEKFTGLYTRLFVFPKPTIAAINGHAIAGGCMLATACDYRIMVTGRARISLNEITFGSSVFAGSVEMLKHCVGSPNARTILLGGAMFGAEEAQALGWVDDVVPEGEPIVHAAKKAREMASGNEHAFAGIKGLLRNRVADIMKESEPDSIGEFVRIWYSEKTRESLKSVRIR